MRALRSIATTLTLTVLFAMTTTSVTGTDLSGPLPQLPKDPQHHVSTPLELSPRLNLSAPFTVELTTSNDIISGDDDLYTADLAFTAVFDDLAVSMNERMFTDRKAGRRHDETVLEFRQTLRDVWGLDGEIALGALRVGRGLFGESFQNAVHGVFANDKVDLAYPSGIDWHAHGRLQLGTDVMSSATVALRAEAVVTAAPGFRSTLETRLAAGREFGHGLFVEGIVGVMASHIETALLSDHVNDVVPTWSVAAGWGPVALQWSANTFGTTQRHIGVVYRFGPRFRNPDPR